MDVRHKGGARFSLLLLEDGERYIADHSCTFEDGSRGRVRLATKSVFLEPASLSLPILRIPFAKMQQVGESQGRCVLVASETTEMKKHGRDYPYVFVSSSRTYIFGLDHASTDAFLLRVAELFQCAKMGPQGRAAIEEVVARTRDDAPAFKLTSLVDWNEEIQMDRICQRVKPFILEGCRLVITTKRLYLQPVDDVEGSTHVFDLRQVRQVFRRRHALREIGLEILMPKKAVFVAMENMSERDAVYKALLHHPVVDLALEKESSDAVTAKWMAGEVSNYDYLMYINNLAGRTKNDMAQYPVFPWVLADYTSATLDLGNPAVFRDLSKPIGALNAQRLETFRQRMREMPANGEEFLYGTHYSTPGYVLFYLVRKRPDLMLRLQNGKFDAPDRSFYSISQTWQSCMQSPTDLKELIPEFFSDASILENALNLELGTRQNGARVDDVELPAWCPANDFKQFIQLHREALESAHVSAHLHEWIDLIFGYKQRGEEAKKADNLYYPLTYQGSINIDEIEDEQMRASYEMQISEFGQTPKQLFFRPHPKRFSSDSVPLSVGTSSTGNLNLDAGEHGGGAKSVDGQTADAGGRKPIMISVEESSLRDLLGEAIVVEPLENFGSSSASSSSSSLSVVSSSYECAQQAAGILHCHDRLHREVITGMCSSGDQLVSVSKDQFVKVHIREGSELKQKRACNVSNFPLSCCQMLTDDVVLIGAWDSKVHLYSISFNRALESFVAHDDTVSSLRYRNSRLCTGGWDTLVRLWNVRGDSVDKVPEVDLYDLDAEVVGVDLLDNGVFLAVSTAGAVLHGDCRVPGHVVNVFQCDTELHCVSLMDDGMRAVCGNHVLELGSGQFSTIADTPEDVRALDTQNSLALLAFDSDLELWDVMLRSKLQLFDQPKPGVTAMHVGDKDGYFGTSQGNLMFY